MRGLLIVFEGLDQSGKETQARLLGERLEAAGRSTRSVSFPDYRTPIGLAISDALHGGAEHTPEVMQLLYIANRYERKADIENWLSGGFVVLSDRYLASSVAYGEAQGVDPEWLFDIQRHLPQPDLTVVLDIAPVTAFERKAAGRDRYEQDVALLSRVAESYRRQARRPGWVLVDGERPVAEVACGVFSAVSRQLALP
jgi:dTMP kinase